jgi:hypothetical protein
MNESNNAEGLNLLDYPAQFLDQLTGLVAKVGVELSPFATQAALLVLSIVIVAAFRNQFWPLKTAKPIGVISAVALLLAAFAIVISWVNELARPLPDHIFGRVQATGLDGLYVSVRDFRDEMIAAGSGAVDSVSGEFALRYRAPFADRPRSLLFSKPGCADQRYNISREKLRSGEEFVVDFACREPV